LSFPLFMNTFFSPERFTRACLRWRVFCLLAVLHICGQHEAAGQNNRVFLPEYFFQQPESSFERLTNTLTIKAMYALSLTSDLSLPFLQQVDVVLLKNGQPIVPAVQPTAVQKFHTTANNLIVYDYWDPYESNPNIVRNPNQVGVYYCYIDEFPRYGTKNTGLGYTVGINLLTARFVWDLTFTLPQATAPTGDVYTIRISDPRTGTSVDSIVAQQCVISSTQIAATPSGLPFEVIQQPKDNSKSSTDSMEFSVFPENHVAALFNTPFGVAADANGFVYVADTSNHCIRQVNPGGRVKTTAGLDGQSLDFGFDPYDQHIAGGYRGDMLYSGSLTARKGRIWRDRLPVSGIRDGRSDQRVLTDTERSLGLKTYRYDTSVSVTSGGAFGTDSNPPDPNWTLSEPLFNNPNGIAVADNGQLFVADTKNNAIRSITVGAGTLINRNDVVTLAPGTLTSGAPVVLNKPRAIALVGSLANYDASNPPALYVVDSSNYRILKCVLDPQGLVVSSILVAGMNQTPGWVGNPAPVQQNFYSPSGMAVSSDQKTIFIADTVNSVIRRLTLDDAGIWNATTVAGMVGAKGSVNSIGTDARLSYPTGLALDELNGFLYFTEFGNHSLRRLILPESIWAISDQTIAPPFGFRYAYQVEAVAGSGSSLLTQANPKGEGTGANAIFNYPAGITFNKVDQTLDNPFGSLLLADTNNHVIRKITINSDTVTDASREGVVKTYAGVTGMSGNQDFYSLSEYPNYDWLFWAQALDLTDPTHYVNPETDTLSIPILSSEDTGPYQVRIYNHFSAFRDSNQAFGYVATSDVPRFLYPGYHLLDSTETPYTLNQVPNQGDDFILLAEVLPADEVTYQWQVAREQDKKVNGYGVGNTEDYPWISLTDLSIDTQGGAADCLGSNKVLLASGTSAFKPIAVSGSNTPKLTVRSFQSSFTGKPPQLRFRVLCNQKGSLATPMNPKESVFVAAGRFDSKLVLIGGGTGAIGGRIIDKNLLTAGTYDYYYPDYDYLRPLVSRDLTNGVKLPSGSAPLFATSDITVNSSTLKNVSGRISSVYVPDGGTVSFTTGALTTNPDATYQWKYVDPVLGAVDVLNASGSVKDGQFITWNPTLSSGVSPSNLYVPEGTYFVSITNGLGVVLESQKVTIRARQSGLIVASTSPETTATGSMYSGSLAVTADSNSLVTGQQIAGGTLRSTNTQIPALGGGSLTLSAEFESSVQPTFKWQFLPYSGTLSGGSITLQSGTLQPLVTVGSVTIGTLKLGNRYITTFSVPETPGIALTADGTYQVTATVGQQSATIAWDCAVKYAPIYKYLSKTSSPSGSLSALDPSSDVSYSLTASFIFNPRFPLSYRWLRNNVLLESGTRDASSISGGTFTYNIGAIRKRKLGTYTLEVGNDSGNVRVGASGVTSGALVGDTLISDPGWVVAAGSKPYFDNEGYAAIDYVANVTNTSSATSISATLLDPDTQTTPQVTSNIPDRQSLTNVDVIKKYVVAGQRVALQFNVNATPPPLYVWKTWTTDPTKQITVSNAAVCSVKIPATAAVATTLGTYQLTATNTIGSPPVLRSTISPKIQLVVKAVPNPSIEFSLATLLKNYSVTLPHGYSSAVFSVDKSTLNSGTLSGGTSSLTYQWRKDGVDLSGGTSSTLNVNSLGLQTANSGLYTVLVRDSDTQTERESRAVSLIVQPAPKQRTTVNNEDPLTGQIISGTTAFDPQTRQPLYTTNTGDNYFRVTFAGTGPLRSFRCVPIPDRTRVNGDRWEYVVAGTKLSWSGVAPSNQMIQCWRAVATAKKDDPSAPGVILSGKSANYIMPSEDITITPVLSRPYSASYCGFLSLDVPWSENQEWGKILNVSQNLDSLRGFLTCALTSTGLISGKVTLEGAVYPFTSTLQPNMTAEFKITTKLPDGNPWFVKGLIAFDPTPENEKSQFSDNMMHVTLNGALLKTPPLLGSSQTLYCAASGNGSSARLVPLVNPTTGLQQRDPATGSVLYQSISGAMGALLGGVNQSVDGITVLGALTSTTERVVYTAAICRHSAGRTVKATLGQGGVFTVSVGNTGIALVTGLYGNGVQFTYAGQLTQAYYDPKEDIQPLVPAFSADGNLATTALQLMSETMSGNTSSVALPIFAKGEKVTEPVFGTCIFSDNNGQNSNTLYGCLGTLNAGTSNTNTSEYTMNYVAGYAFDPTLNRASSVLTTGTSSLGGAFTVSLFTNETYKFDQLLGRWVSGTLSTAPTGATWAFPIANANKTFGWTPGSATSSTGNFSPLTFLESTTRYVSNATKEFPNFAAWYNTTKYPVVLEGKSYLATGVAGVLLCGSAPGGVPLLDIVSTGGRVITPTLPYGAGFLLRGLSSGTQPYGVVTSQTLQNTLGNGATEAITIKKTGLTTRRTEAVTILIGDPH